MVRELVNASVARGRLRVGFSPGQGVRTITLVKPKTWTWGYTLFVLDYVDCAKVLVRYLLKATPEECKSIFEGGIVTLKWHNKESVERIPQT